MMRRTTGIRMTRTGGYLGYLELVIKEGVSPIAVVACCDMSTDQVLREHGILFFDEEPPPYSLWANARKGFPKRVKEQDLKVFEFEGCFCVPFSGDSQDIEAVLEALLSVGFNASKLLGSFSDGSLLDVLMRERFP